jgi:cytidine deaminase
LTECAERVALFKAVSAGEREFTSIAIVADSPTLIVPCGACRQVLAEFNADMRIICANLQHERQEFSLSTLFPYSFQMNK